MFRWMILEQYDTWSVLAATLGGQNWRVVVMPSANPPAWQVRAEVEYLEKRDADHFARFADFKRKHGLTEAVRKHGTADPII